MTGARGEAAHGFNHDEDGPAVRVRAPELWARPCWRTRHAGKVGLVVGADCGVELRGGKLFVGTVVGLSSAIVVLAGYGHPRPLRLRLSRVLAAAPLGAHSYRERAVVVQRQARGEPAAVL